MNKFREYVDPVVYDKDTFPELFHGDLCPPDSMFEVDGLKYFRYNGCKLGFVSRVIPLFTKKPISEYDDETRMLIAKNIHYELCYMVLTLVGENYDYALRDLREFRVVLDGETLGYSHMLGYHILKTTGL